MQIFAGRNCFVEFLRAENRGKYLVKESLKRKSESHGEQPSLSMESDFDDTIWNEDIDDILMMNHQSYPMMIVLLLILLI